MNFADLCNRLSSLNRDYALAFPGSVEALEIQLEIDRLENLQTEMIVNFLMGAEVETSNV